MTRYKYPKTFHLPFSKSINSDDKINKDFEANFKGKKVVITTKMDGENMTIYNDYFHSRSLDSKKKNYQTLMYSLINGFQHLLEPDIRLCGEYLYAQHSIKYEQLDSYFQLFSVWEKDTCLSWNKVDNISKELNIPTVPVLYIGEYSLEELKKQINYVEETGQEGLVLRVYDEFNYTEFSTNVIKYVRENHNQTDKNWIQNIEYNKLKN